MEKITSLQNPKIKQIIKLKKARERKKNNLIIIEGRHEINMALTGGVNIVELYKCKDFPSDENFKVNVEERKIIKVSKEVFNKISMRDNPDGFLALAKRQELELDKIKLSKNPLIVILESVEKPGNLGAVIRTADAAGVDAIILCDSKTDIYNPNVIRASLGAVFTKQVVECATAEAQAWLRKNNIKSLATTPDTNQLYTEADYSGPSAVVTGAEHEGLSKEWLENADQKIKIPMKGSIDSLNASASAAVVVFEVVRQRSQLS